jgi:hypothetical protein
LLEKLERPLDSRHWRADVRPPLESGGGLGFQPEFPAGEADALGFEAGALEHDGLVAALTSDRRATHNAGDGLRFLRVGDDQHPGFQRPVGGIEGFDALAFHRAADAQLASGQLRQVEGMHRLSELEQDIVGDVHHVIDGADAARPQPGREPFRRRPLL